MISEHGLIAGLILGLIQGMTEWLPISSEATVALTYSYFFDRTINEVVSYALWLHVGTAFSSIIAFRKDFISMGNELFVRRRIGTPLLQFMATATISSSILGLTLLIGFYKISEFFGNITMILVGVLLIGTAFVHFRSTGSTVGHNGQIDRTNSILTGIAQGFAVLPGLSRSALTVMILLMRGMDRKTALKLSYILSVPASLGAGLWVGIREGFVVSPGSVLALLVAAVVGLLTINFLLAVATRVKFAPFVAIAGLIVIAVSILRLTVT